MAALIFTPTLGALIGKTHERAPRRQRTREGPYLKTVRLAVRHPGITILLAFALLIGVPILYGEIGKGVEFFPNVEPDVGRRAGPRARQPVAGREGPAGARGRGAHPRR